VAPKATPWADGQSNDLGAFSAGLLVDDRQVGLGLGGISPCSQVAIKVVDSTPNDHVGVAAARPLVHCVFETSADLVEHVSTFGEIVDACFRAALSDIAEVAAAMAFCIRQRISYGGNAIGSSRCSGCFSAGAGDRSNGLAAGCG